MGFCYAHVTLGFHALENKQVKVVLGDVERTFFGGKSNFILSSYFVSKLYAKMIS
jgi:hypothetical protein